MLTNNVFANGLEVACKAAIGKSIAAAPDVCWSPPPPSAGPIPIPYANTAYAKDTVNGSKTVFISGKPVVLKNKSYLKTSTGNEAATKAFRKGIVSGVIQGKCFFSSWSPNVKIEGYNVCRHTDMTTHNHGSTSNGAMTSYLDTASVKAACADDKKKIDEACGDNPEGEDWKRHCPDLEKDLKLTESELASVNDLSQQLDNTTDLLKHKALELADNLGMTPQEVAKALTGKGVEAFATQAEKILAAKAGQAVTGKAAAKVAGKVALRVALKAIPIVGWASLAYDAYQLGKYVLSTSPQELLAQIKEAANLEKSLKDRINDVRARAYTEYAEENDCLNARKCMLVPFNKSKDKNGSGCCPGQTGHHLIPKASFYETPTKKPSSRRKSKIAKINTPKKKLAKWQRYSEGKALTVCVEGRSHSTPFSSHKKIHRAYNDEISGKQKLTYKQASDAATQSHQNTFKSADCDPRCIQAQIDSNHKPFMSPGVQYLGAINIRAIRAGKR